MDNLLLVNTCGEEEDDEDEQLIWFDAGCCCCCWGEKRGATLSNEFDSLNLFVEWCRLSDEAELCCEPALGCWVPLFKKVCIISSSIFIISFSLARLFMASLNDDPTVVFLSLSCQSHITAFVSSFCLCKSLFICLSWPSTCVSFFLSFSSVCMYVFSVS